MFLARLAPSLGGVSTFENMKLDREGRMLGPGCFGLPDGIDRSNLRADPGSAKMRTVRSVCVSVMRRR